MTPMFLHQLSEEDPSLNTLGFASVGVPPKKYSSSPLLKVLDTFFTDHASRVIDGQLPLAPDFFETLDTTPYLDAEGLQYLYATRDLVIKYSKSISDESGSKKKLEGRDIERHLHDLEQLKKNALTPLVGFLETVFDYELLVEKEDIAKAIERILLHAEEMHEKIEDHVPSVRLRFISALLQETYRLVKEVIEKIDQMQNSIQKEFTFLVELVRTRIEEIGKEFTYLKGQTRQVSLTL